MKHLITTILFFLLINPLFANDGKKTMEQVDTNTYHYTEYNDNGELHQEGYFKLVNGEFIRHGLWSNFQGTKAKYDSGKLVWIKPIGQKKYTYKQIEYERLKLEVVRLRTLLASTE